MKKETPAQLRRRVDRAEARYLELKEEVDNWRKHDMKEVIELADHRHYKKQVRLLLIEAIELLDAIGE